MLVGVGGGYDLAVLVDFFGNDDQRRITRRIFLNVIDDRAQKSSILRG